MVISGHIWSSGFFACNFLRERDTYGGADDLIVFVQLVKTHRLTRILAFFGHNLTLRSRDMSVPEVDFWPRPVGVHKCFFFLMRLNERSAMVFELLL